MRRNLRSCQNGNFKRLNPTKYFMVLLMNINSSYDGGSWCFIEIGPVFLHYNKIKRLVAQPFVWSLHGGYVIRMHVWCEHRHMLIINHYYPSWWRGTDWPDHRTRSSISDFCIGLTAWSDTQHNKMINGHAFVMITSSIFNVSLVDMQSHFYMLSTAPNIDFDGQVVVSSFSTLLPWLIIYVLQRQQIINRV